MRPSTNGWLAPVARDGPFETSNRKMKFCLSTKVNRRSFVRACAASAGGLIVGAPIERGAQAAAPTRKIPVGLELYSLRDQCKTDLLGTLVVVGKIGYKGVEFAGYHGHGAAEI